MTRPGIEPRFPGPLANTLPTRPMRIPDIYFDCIMSPRNKNNLVIFGLKKNELKLVGI